MVYKRKHQIGHLMIRYNTEKSSFQLDTIHVVDHTFKLRNGGKKEKEPKIKTRVDVHEEITITF